MATGRSGRVGLDGRAVVQTSDQHSPA